MKFNSGSTDGFIKRPIPQLLCDFSIAKSLIKKSDYGGELFSCQFGLNAILFYHLPDHTEQGLLDLTTSTETAMTGSLLLHDLGCSADLQNEVPKLISPATQKFTPWKLPCLYYKEISIVFQIYLYPRLV